MTLERDFTDFPLDIRDNALIATSFVRDMSFEEFEHDLRTQYAVVRALEIIGEATKQVPALVRRRHRDIPWKEMAGMRDRLVHGCSTVDLRIMRQMAKHDLPVLQSVFQRVIEEESGFRGR
ncbi:MAG: hypothetical protein BWY06_02710 [Candidatus Latescibacteria bacterium ADurb.Bin168]|nr:MAG: hypothetical protein BWY06_02710 [Candidatus Latescibacteria bacterium ADurb.Bin168]